jgi:hypothetical protein
MNGVDGGAYGEVGLLDVEGPHPGSLLDFSRAMERTGDAPDKHVRPRFSRGQEGDVPVHKREHEGRLHHPDGSGRSTIPNGSIMDASAGVRKGPSRRLPQSDAAAYTAPTVRPNTAWAIIHTSGVLRP